MCWSPAPGTDTEEEIATRARVPNNNDPRIDGPFTDMWNAKISSGTVTSELKGPQTQAPFVWGLFMSVTRAKRCNDTQTTAELRTTAAGRGAFSRACGRVQLN